MLWVCRNKNTLLLLINKSTVPERVYKDSGNYWDDGTYGKSTLLLYPEPQEFKDLKWEDAPIKVSLIP